MEIACNVLNKFPTYTHSVVVCIIFRVNDVAALDCTFVGGACFQKQHHTQRKGARDGRG